MGDEGLSAATRQVAAYPIGAAFLRRHRDAVPRRDAGTDYHASTTRLAPTLAFPLGFYIDRLSAVMMVLISGVGTVIYTYSIGYMYQDRHYPRYLALMGFTTSCCSAWSRASIS